MEIVLASAGIHIGIAGVLLLCAFVVSLDITSWIEPTDQALFDAVDALGENNVTITDEEFIDLFNACRTANRHERAVKFL